MGQYYITQCNAVIIPIIIIIKVIKVISVCICTEQMCKD